MIKYFTFSILMLAATVAFPQIDLPVTFDDGSVTYTLTDFGGNSSTVGADPKDASNKVGITEKTNTAETWAGTTIGPATGFTKDIPFTTTDTKISIRVYSPDAGIPVRLKVEDKADDKKSVETEAVTTKANEWETLVFDFANQAAGTAVINLSYAYNKASVFFNFGTTGASAGSKTYYWDDVMFVESGPKKAQVNLPVSFDDTANVDYILTDFGGNASELVVDPAGGTNLVAKSIKSATAETWAGTTCGGAFGFKDPVPFTASATKMYVNVYSPAAGIVVRLKVEMASNNQKTCETEATTTKAGAWEYLEFDFSQQATGTAALDVATPYNKASIFFNFGTSGVDAGEQTFYWDDLTFGSKPSSVLNLNNDVKFAPNPIVDVVNINAINNIDQVEVFNYAGQLLMTLSGSGNNMSIDMSDYQAGAYVFVVSQGETKNVLRAIKN